MPLLNGVRICSSQTIQPFSGKHDTTTKDKIARRKLILLELATDLDNVSKACRLMGYSRQQFYEIRRHFQTHGAASRAAETN